MGINGSVRILTKDNKDVTSQFRRSYPEGTEAFDEYVAKALLKLNREIIEGPAPSKRNEFRKLGWDPHRTFKAVEQAALEEAAQVAREGLNKSSYGAKQTLYLCLFRIQAL